MQTIEKYIFKNMWLLTVPLAVSDNIVFVLNGGGNGNEIGESPRNLGFHLYLSSSDTICV